MNMDVFSLLDTVQTIARNGLLHVSNEYDKERYERLLEMAAKTYSDILNIPSEKIKQGFSNELGTITPKLGTNAAIFNERGEILLMERVDGSRRAGATAGQGARVAPLSALRAVRQGGRPESAQPADGARRRV